ncbi:LexA family protein [Streptomyces formicae]|uniref:LexA repressor DNA-binding domain-containing protein n=1 Tax=Streptomyces formicae TaxID=1616117 RepID=A0A291QI98_9ACTN|nr:helix-turn-helix domain-containing protein [Streptomyces formicae]ATL31247.1 hypothetical protein KY5_6229c [Streptomyces formicae]
MIDAPTERQVQILRCMREVIAERSEAPTLTEIAARVGLSGKSAVHYQLGRLQKLGMVARDDHRRRAYRGPERVNHRLGLDLPSLDTVTPPLITRRRYALGDPRSTS